MLVVQSGDLKELLRANERKEGKYQYKKRIRFSLKKDELEQQIRKLIETTNTMRKLRDLTATLNDSSSHSLSRTIAKFATFLQGIRGHAKLLYEAIAQRLACGSHHEHGTKFHLGGQAAVLRTNLKPLSFKLAIEAQEAGTREGSVQYEVGVEVLEVNATEYGL